MKCSTQQLETLPGTAKAGSKYVVLEYLHGWGRDVLDDDVFGPELAAKMRAHLKAHGAGLQLVRKPGRAGQHRQERYLYVAFTGDGETPPAMRRLKVSGPEDVLSVDLSSPDTVGGEDVTHPLLLVCTHGKRDMCCALRGRPLAASLQACFYGDEVWESSHTKGHRFAPSLILLPWGYSFGRMNSSAALDMLKAASRGEMFVPGNRGRGCFDRPGQVAEIAVANELFLAGECPGIGVLAVRADVDPAPAVGQLGDNEQLRRVIHPDGRSWDVVISAADTEPVAASCGAQPKPQVMYSAQRIVAVDA
ncbi:hypothetical protein CAQU_02360 [Corynebacterium aquilae DSM 44791]|uniref:Sucrase ferredoxin n=1 Tax=Corynebacterium aquilae DSM 44791 TaxID=1431546 RepID=A0A1L7CE44_9CORY|nr:hypothetical protein CAQU_02360 [Corynebacterium aquilae DSM 44791]